jgi:ribosomal protein S21
MPYINVYVQPLLDEAIRCAAESDGKEWSRSKWLRKLAQRELANMPALTRKTKAAVAKKGASKL